jgi:mono/diheme cytochrome c family protein
MKKVLLALALMSLAVMGCRGAVSAEPPFHPQTNMDQQNRYDPQEPNAFFEDNRSARPHVEGTVPRGSLHEDDHLWRGKKGAEYALDLPALNNKGHKMELNQALLERGQERYNIYCTPCHDGAGTGDGIVIQRGFEPKPPSFHDERVLSLRVGAIYNIVTNGVRNMPPYRHQIGVDDRWAIAAYVRALQLSRSGSLKQIPADKAASRRWEIR